MMSTLDSDGLRWHYTVGIRFQQIAESGEIRPAMAYVPKNEKPAVWFSTNPVWEQTANKSWMNENGSLVHLNMKQSAEHGNGLFRIGVLADTAPHDWQAFKKLSGITAKAAEGLYNRAKVQDARPGQWYVTFETVPKFAWISIEVWDGVNPAGWTPYDPEKNG